MYQPFRFKGWESHPFTLGAWNYEDDQRSHTEATLTTLDDEIDGSKLPLLSVSASPYRRNTYTKKDKTLGKRPKLVFWIRPYDGWTRHLRDECLASANNSTFPTILLEGPYGASFPLWKYDFILFIAGGTGIACAIPYIQQHLCRGGDKNDDNKDSERLIVNKISLVWAAREVAFVHDVASRELRDALSRDEFEALFYITASQSNTAVMQATTSERINANYSFSSNDYNPTRDANINELNFHHGRPDTQNLVLRHAQEAHNSNSSIAIVVSGPYAMADEVRTAVYLALCKGYRGITFHEESFSW
ncbi:uncharacterized protein BHQ10_008176 [Talaromyces amestolkiae]|uniref:Ferric reductase NAD binding domain-containing protein n=1 Tax=Talaromyces amestolkiae TaxID=1196081 RepID=A0A364L8M1_TALAM|nr:uncharacterized protein BHQ10_008176 [Talaromyces amestolkiae]RAO72164.1 hypothetical protein BHQ10_008176 [Talaromyces amestolkiae]